MIESVLIANRGEIARRVIRTARRLGVRAIAVYSEADAGAPHVREADEAVAIGPAPARESYLSHEAILSAARKTGAAAIHPGYGFLSENADFAEAAVAAGLVWIGAPPAAIRAMGLKDAAKRLMAQAGVPVTPGYLGDDQSPQALAREAAAIGWPVLIKAVAGGGGKGMRAVHDAEGFEAALAGARREALSAFGDDRVLLEKLIAAPRHIEVQVFADGHGGAVHLFERDCSLQRRHQKVIEEAPAPGMDPTTRQSICEAAVRAARAVDYRGAGTVEFIADASEGLRADRIWFMEMNTRLQVEHPVTEAVTGLDLVEWQLRVASGEPLPLSQAEITLNGHAVEARLYAEDPAHGFLPSVGALRHMRLPDFVRVDSGVEAGGAVSAYYDPMIAKLIAFAPSRESAAAELGRAARAVEVWPVKTNAAFLARCLDHPDFRAGAIDTGFIDANLEDLTRPPPLAPPAAAVGRLVRWAGADSPKTPGAPWDAVAGLTGLRLNGPSQTRASIYVDGVATPVDVDLIGDGIDLVRHGDEAIYFQDGGAHTLSLTRSAETGAAGDLQGGAILTPMPGRIVSVAVKVGERVARGQALVVLEAMKMEHALTAPADGRVVALAVAVGDQVAEGVAAVRLEPLE
jgi:propionyl-CoA carboxylase alpha chain/3-methylcrotonyl-CoA carboxylase alpha subunit